MIFTELELSGVFSINVEKLIDERGFFARSFDTKIFNDYGLKSNFVQCNISSNIKKGTIRGLHFQTKPYEEAKLVRCTQGKVFEVIVDIRKNSKTFLNSINIELSSENHTMIYVPEGFALGFQTLEDNCELFYQMSQYYMPEYAKGILWNDPKLNISWPLNPTVISKKDLSFSPINIEEFI